MKRNKIVSFVIKHKTPLFVLYSILTFGLGIWFIVITVLGTTGVDWAKAWKEIYNKWALVALCIVYSIVKDAYFESLMKDDDKLDEAEKDSPSLK